MNIKKFSLSLFMASFTFLFSSCGNNSADKNEVPKPTSQDVVETKKSDTSTVKTVLPDGEITLDRLPFGIKEFIIKNYTGYKMVNAASDPLCEGGDAIDVAVAKAGAPNLSLIFRPDGSFVQQEEDVPLSRATSKIINILKTKYADYTVGTQIEKLILADNTVQYMADLTKGKISKEVIFAENGVVVCEK